MSVLVGVDFFPMPVFMAVGVSLLMAMQMLIFGYFFTWLPFERRLFSCLLSL